MSWAEVAKMKDFVGIKSIQRGVMDIVSNPTEITINKVVPAKSVVLYGGSITTESPANLLAMVYLKNETTLVGKKGRDNSGSTPLSWQVIEFY